VESRNRRSRATRAQPRGAQRYPGHWELEELNRIGIALSENARCRAASRSHPQKAREITAADAGSLYLVERDSETANRALRPPRLRFKLIQNDSVQFPFSEHTLPLTEESIAGYCALHAE